MRPQDVLRLFALTLIWGGSFIFISVSVKYLGPVGTAGARVTIAAVALSLYAWARQSPLQLRERAGQYLMVGLLNSAIPFAFIGAAEMKLTASLAAILNATTPIFGAIVSRILLGEGITSLKALGMAAAVVGVAMVVGWSGFTPGVETYLAVGASLLAALSYSVAGVYIKTKAKGSPSMGLAVGSMFGATLLCGLAYPLVPAKVTPPVAGWLCILGLGLLCTASAYVLYFRLMVDVGPTKTLTVTFLTPISGVLWGYLLLGERLTLGMLMGCCCVLLGTTLVTEAWKAFIPAPSLPSVSAEES